MKWTDYPFQIISDAAATTIGGVLAIVFGLSAGTSIAGWVGDPDFLRNTAYWQVPLMAFGFVGMMCIQVWGIFYVAFLMAVLHRTLFAEVSRLLVFLLLAVTQTCAVAILEICRDSMHAAPGDSSRSHRALLVFCALVLAGVVCWVIRRLKQGGKTSS